MSLLTLYTACSILPLLLLIALAAGLLLKHRGAVMLCTECQSCITHCPGRHGKVNAFQGMIWAKTGARDDQFYKDLNDVCIRCGMCRVDCPRGLAACELLPPERSGKKIKNRDAAPGIIHEKEG
ncbi:MAG: hypothetical protein LBB60_00410 [Desulfovibrio sp.]|nr:hypothetical protein [Desulfovibrio sp.]